MVKIKRGNVEFNGEIEEIMTEIIAGAAVTKENILLNEDIAISKELVEFFNDTLVEIAKIKTLEEMEKYLEEE